MSPISNASRLADFGSGIGTQGAVLQVDNLNNRVGIGTTNPQAMLQVGTAISMFGSTGIVSATSFYGSGEGLTGVASTDYIITGTAATFTNQVDIDNLGVTGVTTTGVGTITTSVVVGSAVTVTATTIVVDPAVTTTIDGDVNFQGGNYNISRSRANSSIDFDDNAKARFGTSADGLEIYHDASDSIINDNGTGTLKLQVAGVTKAELTAIGAKVTGELEVTSGVQATGVVTATSFAGSGENLTNLPASGDSNDITACLFI